MPGGRVLPGAATYGGYPDPVLVFTIESWIVQLTSVALLGVKAFAFVHALTVSGKAYEAAGKMTKLAWCTLLAISLLAQVVFFWLGPINPINLIFTIVTFVYLADVKPAVGELRRS